jgi:hypothetical protein
MAGALACPRTAEGGRFAFLTTGSQAELGNQKMSKKIFMDKLVPGLFALLGVFVGGYLTVQAQYHKLLLERRSEAFAKFLELIDIAHKKASAILDDRSLQAGAKRDLKILDVYQPVLIQARIVRLYLPKKFRDEFFSLAKSYWARHTDPALGDSRLLRMGQDLERIQEIFEQELSPHFWLRPVCECFSRLKSHLPR